MKSKFVAIEGVDCVGKSTLTRYLGYKHMGEVFICKSFSDREFGKAARAELRKSSMNPQKFLLFALLDMMDIYENDIKPALERGEHVIIDRWFMSTLVYQVPLLKGIHHAEYILNKFIMHIMNFKIPDHTFILDCPLEVSLERMKKRGGSGDAIESNIELLKEVKERYIHQAQCITDGPRSLVHANMPVEDIAERIEQYLEL